MLRLCFLIIIFSSCGKDHNPLKAVTKQDVQYRVEPALNEAYSYEFTTLKCTTGEQSFNTFLKACNGLKDDEKNNSCAEAKREQLFISEECPGSFKD